MGGAMVDYAAHSIFGELNARFGAGDPIAEMSALQREFRIFSERHDLSAAAAVLNIVPTDPANRARWLAYLDSTKKFRSDVPKQNGHDRTRSALQANLESARPLPVYFTWHSARKDPRLTVSVSADVAYMKQRHLIISVPTTPSRQTRQRVARMARARRRRRASGAG